MQSLIVILIAAVAGMTMAIQGALNSILGKITGELEATFVVHIIALLIVIIFLFIFDFGKGDLSQLVMAPWYSYLGGILNVIILYGVLFSMPRLGVANATTIIIIGQVLTALIIDHIGLGNLEELSFSWAQLVGLVFLSVGVRLLLDC